MQQGEKLRKILLAIDGRGYKAYKEIEGAYKFDLFDLFIDHVQGDPFAAPSRLRVRVDQKTAQIPTWAFRNPYRQMACCDFLTRAFAKAIRRYTEGKRGSGKSGLFAVDTPGQQVLKRTSCLINEDFVEVRFVCGLPAAGRRVLGREALEMFFDELPRIVEGALFYRNIDGENLRRHVEVVEDHFFIKEKLKEQKLVSFIADGSILPRESGASQRPMKKSEAVAFNSPPSLRIKLTLPNKGEITGMGIPEGVTLITGGGYHGKTTLLEAIEMGIYPHIPGDGREYVATVEDAVKIRAEDGRSVKGVDISLFINNLPGKKDTKFFSTDDASGSTSQASNIQEALEMEAKLLLIDEDTSATNFMIRDARMQKLIAKDKEPITPFIDHVRGFFEELGVSTILVIGGSGDYLDVADKVIMMDEYIPKDVTALAKEVAKEITTQRHKETKAKPYIPPSRVPSPRSINPHVGKKVKVKAGGLKSIIFGSEAINLYALSSLVDESQTRMIAEMWHYAYRKGYIDGKRSIKEIVEQIFSDVENKGLDIISPHRYGHPGDYALPRKLEVAFAINRLRGLKVVNTG